MGREENASGNYRFKGNKMKTIALIYGARSSEHEVSIKSAQNLYFQLQKLDYNIFLIKITKQGNYLLTENVTFENTGEALEIKMGRGFFNNGQKLPIDLCFIIAHGSEGEDGKLQGLLDMLDLPYTSPSLLASALCMSKTLTKDLVNKYIKTVPGLETLNCPNLEEIKHLGNKIFVKPEAGGSSFGISLLSELNSSNIEKAFYKAKKYSEKVLFETYIENKMEIDCGVYKDHDKIIPTLPGTITNSQGPLTYCKKYSSLSKAIFLCPPPISQEQIYNIQNLSKIIFEALNLNGFARLDYFLDLDSNNLYLNEINTIPGMTENSHFPIMLEKSGISITSFLKALVETNIRKD